MQARDMLVKGKKTVMCRACVCVACACEYESCGPSATISRMVWLINLGQASPNGSSGNN